MAARATRCPHCQTSFRVTEAQLATARGLVRCGACLEVFDARNNWVETTPLEDTEALKAEPGDEANSASGDNPPAPVQDGAEPTSDSAEATRHFSPQSPPTEAETPNKVTPAIHVDTPATEHLNTHDSAVDDDAGSRLHEDLWEDSDTENDAADDPSDAWQPNERLKASRETDETDYDSEETAAHDYLSTTDTDDEFDQLVDRHKRQIRINRQQAAWSLLSILALAALLGQMIYTNFNSLAQSAHREKLAATCRVVNWLGGSEACRLPPPQNLARIESRGLNVLSHPEYANSLLIDAVIINTANFSQPFPALELAFTNERGAVVAARQFLPREYLHGELAGESMMPVGQSVRIQISVLDPGSSAINYQMHFSPAQQPM
ncbi:DUF3426 domain-containing protein [Litorivivens sp.]|uniref:DUF3426 domain-containing protein n=3 Tax=Litorivivens sp. TaxID=2020868 RepID=UPI003565E929